MRTPYYEYRILDHWDNLDDTVERGYAGPSIWSWTDEVIPAERIHTYGRLNKSIGINGSVLNNVNANPKILDADTWNKVQERLEIQEADARWWRDACVQYFQRFSKMDVPEDLLQPEIPLDTLYRRRGDPPRLRDDINVEDSSF